MSNLPPGVTHYDIEYAQGFGHWLDTQEVAERYSVKAPTVTAWIRRGLLPAIKFGRDWFVLSDTLETFIPPDPRGGWPEQRRNKRDA